MSFKQYDVVKVVALHAFKQEISDSFNLRPPRIGDIATIVEIYAKPPGYELECSDKEGITQWLQAFAQDEIGLALAADN